MEEEDDDAWVCNSCTFENHESCQACSMCHTVRPSLRWPLQQYSSHFSIYAVPKFLGHVLSCVLTGAFALVGAFTGAITGALAGRASQSGFLRGAGLGTVAGAVLAVELLEASRAYWHSERSGSSSLPSISDFVDDLITGRFVQDFLLPAFSATQRWQLNVSDMSYEELYEMFIPGEVKVKGASQGMLQSLPQHIVTETNRRDVSEDVMSCTICLQELEQGDLARTLPTCNHTFHLKCVDRWLAKHFICPMCRQYIQCEKVINS